MSNAKEQAVLWAQVVKWREAHPTISVRDDVLLSMAEFPSLSLTDYIVAVEAKGDDPKLAVYLKAIRRELNWAYDNWKASTRNNSPEKLLATMYNDVRKEGEESVRRFIRDFGAANNIDFMAEFDKNMSARENLGLAEAAMPTDA